MSFIRLIYASTVNGSLGQSDVELILEYAKKNNAERGVTGILYFNNEFFIQCLEGDRENVNILFNTIMKDSRHKKVIILDYQEIHSRDFEEWSMGYIPISSLTKPLIAKFSPYKEFNPYQLTANSAYSLLLEFKKSLPRI